MTIYEIKYCPAIGFLELFFTDLDYSFLSFFRWKRVQANDDVFKKSKIFIFFEGFMEYTHTYWNFMVILASYSFFLGGEGKKEGVFLKGKKFP